MERVSFEEDEKEKAFRTEKTLLRHYRKNTQRRSCQLSVANFIISKTSVVVVDRIFCSFFFLCVFSVVVLVSSLVLSQLSSRGKKKKKDTRAKSDDRTTSRTNQQHTTTDYPTTYSILMAIIIFFLPCFFSFWDWVSISPICYRWQRLANGMSSLFFGLSTAVGTHGIIIINVYTVIRKNMWTFRLYRTGLWME